MRLHIRAQDGVDAGLVAALLPEPGQQVGIQPHSHNAFRSGPYHFCIFPEGFIRWANVGSEAMLRCIWASLMRRSVFQSVAAARRDDSSLVIVFMPSSGDLH